MVGDTAVGKSCLITNYLNNSFSEDYEPTVLDVFRVIKKQIGIEFHDTSGDEHLGVNRKVQYKDADYFIICVCTNQPSSLYGVERWKAEIQEVEPDVPIALYLTKSDLIDYYESDDVVNEDMIIEMKKELGFNASAATSSKEWEDFNVHKAFNKALAAAYNYKYEV